MFLYDLFHCTSGESKNQGKGGNDVSHAMTGKTRLTYNCAHLRSTKESLIDSVKKIFVRKFVCVKIFFGENLLGEHFLSEHFFFDEIFWVKIFEVKIFSVKFFSGEILG